MRVIAGSLGARQFDAPKGYKTHPMSDKARGALFNMLGELDGLRVLDAFAGSGALGFEAISRGAAHVTAIESDKQAQKVMAANIGALELADSVRLIKATANAWLQTNAGAQFDLVLCDPPYNDLQPNLLSLLAERVKSGGLLILSWPAGNPLPDFAGFEQLQKRQHGDLTLVFYRRTA